MELDELERSDIVQAAQAPFVNTVTICSCRGMCLRERGRNACPCKNAGHFCSSRCHVSHSTCLNKLSVSRGHNGSDSSSSEFENPSSDTDEQLHSQSERARRGGPRLGNRRATRPSRRARSRGASRGQRSRVRRGGPARDLAPEPSGEERCVAQEQQLQELVQGLDLESLQRLAIELLRRQPAVFADLVNGELPVGNQDPTVPPPNASQPDWCKCGLCRPMPTQIENKCCTRSPRPCITTTPLFSQLVLNANVLDIAMRYREDFLAMEHPRNNENFRHTAYRQYVLWQHGRLGQGNRRVIPSCCINSIRERYPSPNGIYTGFQPTRL